MLHADDVLMRGLVPGGEATLPATGSPPREPREPRARLPRGEYAMLAVLVVLTYRLVLVALARRPVSFSDLKTAVEDKLGKRIKVGETELLRRLGDLVRVRPDDGRWELQREPLREAIAHIAQYLVVGVQPAQINALRSPRLRAVLVASLPSKARTVGATVVAVHKLTGKKVPTTKIRRRLERLVAARLMRRPADGKYRVRSGAGLRLLLQLIGYQRSTTTTAKSSMASAHGA